MSVDTDRDDARRERDVVDDDLAAARRPDAA